MNTAWMIRNDGKAFPVDHHIYADPEDPDDILRVAEWLHKHLEDERIHLPIIRLFTMWALEQDRDRPVVKTLLEYASENVGFFASEGYIEEISEQLSYMEDRIKHQAKQNINDYYNLVLSELNQDFLRARYGGMYETEKGCKDMIFRISSGGFDWYPIIARFVYKHDRMIETVSIVRDAESTGMKNRPYPAMDGKRLYDKMPLTDFLNENPDGSLRTNHLFYIEGSELPVVRGIRSGLFAGRSFGSLRCIGTVPQVLKQIYDSVEAENKYIFNAAFDGGRF